jgi:hypothetical protein
MSNEITLVRTAFQNLDARGRVRSTDYGYRLYDEHGATYNNLFDSLDELLSYSPHALVEHARDQDEIARGLFAYASESRKPVWVDNIPVYVSDCDEDILEAYDLA